jgi:hypothetical protein
LSAAAILWALSIGQIDVRALDDLGFVSQMPPLMVVSLGLLAIGFALTLRVQPLPVWLGIAPSLLVIAMVYGLPTFVEDAPRFAVAYLHAGFTDRIATDGTLLPFVDARFNWPLFFVLGALVTQVAGIANALAMQPWAPVVSTLLYLPPVIVIYRSLTTDMRLVWAAVFVFVAANWIGQDYYAPQAFNYLLYLTVLAILFRWFRVEGVPAWIGRAVEWVDRRWSGLRAPMRDLEPVPSPDRPFATPSQRAMLVVVLVILIGASAASHQLTPFAILAAVTALAVLGRTQLRGLPIITAVIVGLWVSYMTVVFLAGNLPGLLEDLLAAGQNASEAVGDRIQGSDTHVFVVQLRLAMTLGFWVLALYGFLRRVRLGYLDLDTVALAFVPFGLLALQSYGGEMLLRVYLFSLPFMAFLVAAAFIPTPARPLSAWTTRALAVAALGLLLALMVTRHGNERADAITPAEAAAAAHLYEIAPDGAHIGAVNSWAPLRFVRYQEVVYTTLDNRFVAATPASIAALIDAPGECGYLFLSRTQQAAAELYQGVDAQAWRRAEQRLVASGLFEPIFRNGDATVLLAVPAPEDCRG